MKRAPKRPDLKGLAPTKKTIASIVEEYYTTAKRPVSLGRYLLKIGVLIPTWYRWVESDPKYKRANDVAKQALGAYREELMMEGKIPAQPFLFLQPHFDPDYKQREIERSMLKKQELPNTQVVVLPEWASKEKIEDESDE